MTCYLGDGQRDEIRVKWDKLVMVDGMITKDAATGVPLAIRKIRAIRLITDPPVGSFRAARGILPWKPRTPTPAEDVRRLRDAEQA